jgi:hypothetical protein
MKDLLVVERILAQDSVEHGVGKKGSNGVLKSENIGIRSSICYYKVWKVSLVLCLT